MATAPLGFALEGCFAAIRPVPFQRSHSAVAVPRAIFPVSLLERQQLHRGQQVFHKV
jgi:hypothetical protein